jgi:uncharacterized protein (TIGR02646 family)
MIKIDKPKTPPAKLTKEGLTATETLKQLYEADAQAYITGKKKFDIDKNIYGHQTVKAALKKAQHDKCCFCERKEEIGHIEHFRGKGGYRQDEQETLKFPGYYWLAYEWENLFFCCPTCNSSYKQNFFPLENPAERALSHKDDISKEKPLIINPASENPEDYVEFYGYTPRAIKGNPKGAETIKRTGLMKEPNISIAKRIELQNLFNEAVLDKSEYASMIRCALKHGFRF